MRYGITPACAGKRRPKRRTKTIPWDHPRVCGEKLVDLLNRYRELGSPPRVRGKVIVTETATGAKGITPACAGKRLKKALKNKDF